MKHFLLITLFLLLPASADAIGSSTTVIARPTTLRKEQRDVFVNKTGRAAEVEKERQKKALEKKTKDVSYTHGPTGISVKHPYNWETYNLAKNKGFTVYYGESVMSAVAVPVPSKKDMSMEELEKWFINKSTFSADDVSIDWYIPSFHLLTTEDATLFGKPAKKFTFTGEFKSTKYHYVQYLTSFDAKMYRVGFTDLPSSFETSLPVFEKMFATLKLKPAKIEAKPKGKTRR